METVIILKVKKLKMDICGAMDLKFHLGHTLDYLFDPECNFILDSTENGLTGLQTGNANRNIRLVD